MKAGFLVWNVFQLGHFAELIQQFDEPDVIFLNKHPSQLIGFDLEWLIPLGAYSRFVQYDKISSLDGQYDVLLTQGDTPLSKALEHTKLVRVQYSLARPKAAYSQRWLTADLGLVYGPASAEILSPICVVDQVGNSRFDRFHEGRLDPVFMAQLKAGLDPSKPNVLFLPTWGDLSSQASYRAALGSLADEYNVIYKPHHNSALAKYVEDEPDLGPGTIDAGKLAQALDIGPHLLALADVVVSDMSGAIFDALYCRKPVVLLGGDDVYQRHKKADPTAIEIARQDEIGPRVQDAEALRDTVAQMIGAHPYVERNEALSQELFVQRGGCAPLAKAAIESFVEEQADRVPPLVRYMWPGKFPTQKPAKSKGKKSAKRGLSWNNRVSRSFWYDPMAHEHFMHSYVVRKYARRRVLDMLWRRHTPVLKWRIKELHRTKNIFELGVLVENWAARTPTHRHYGLDPYLQLVAELRFSRHETRKALRETKEWADKAPANMKSKAKRIYRLLGLFDRLDSSPNSETPSRIDLGKAQMGRLSHLFQRAAENELLEPEDQIVVCADARELALRDADQTRVFEMPIYRAFSKLSKDNDGLNRRAMIALTQAFVDVLHHRGWHILPRMQTGYKLAVPVSGHYPCATWHTIHTGLERQIHLKIGSLPAYIVVDRQGYSGWASIAHMPLERIIENVDLGEARRTFDELRAAIVDRGLSKYTQTVEELPDLGRYIFLPMQVLDDAVAKLSYIDCLQLLHLLADWGKSRDLKIVVKRHPKCRSPEVARALELLEGVGQIVVSGGAVHDLVRGADCVVTVNSGVGAESLLQLKPVITTGGADYGAATCQVRTPAELEAALETFGQPYLADDDIKRFMWFYARRYQVAGDRPDDMTARIGELLDEIDTERATLHARSALKPSVA